MVAPGALGPAAATNLMMPALEAYSAAAMREYDAAAGRLHQEALEVHWSTPEPTDVDSGFSAPAAPQS